MSVSLYSTSRLTNRLRLITMKRMWKRMNWALFLMYERDASLGMETRNKSLTAWTIRFGFGGTSHRSMLMVRFSRSPSCLLIWDLRLA